MTDGEIIARVERRRKWTAEEKAALLAEVEAEGGKVSVVARRHRISDSLLYNWRSAWKAAVAAACAPTALEFVPLGVVGRADDVSPTMLAASVPVRSEQPRHGVADRVGVIEIELSNAARVVSSGLLGEYQDTPPNPPARDAPTVASTTMSMKCSCKTVERAPLYLHVQSVSWKHRRIATEQRLAFHMRKAGRTKALYAGSFDPITRGHLDIIGKALMTFDAVHVAIGTNVKKHRAFGVEESLRLIERSIVERWPEAVANASELPSGNLLFEGALEVGEYTNQSLITYARKIAATHIVRGLREASDFNEEFKLHGVAGRIDPSIPVVHFICEAQFLHVSSSTAKELDAMGEDIGWLVMPNVEAAFAGRRRR